jgi:hypothetical protein
MTIGCLVAPGTKHFGSRPLASEMRYFSHAVTFVEAAKAYMLLVGGKRRMATCLPSRAKFDCKICAFKPLEFRE